MSNNQSDEKIKESLRNAYGDDEIEIAADDTARSSNNPGENSGSNAELVAAQALAKENWEKFLRLQADLQNLQRRAERDIANAHRYALDKFVDALLPILDSLEHAMAAATANSTSELQAMQEGVALTYKMFLDTMAKFNVKQLDPAGAAFNPEFHEAISMQPNPELADGTIMMVVQKGYELNGRIVRPARVVVAKN